MSANRILYRIGQFSELVGVSIDTLREWDRKGILKPASKTYYGERLYSEEQLQQVLQKLQNRKNIKNHHSEPHNISDTAKQLINVGYARVSSKDQEDDLNKQIDLLELFLVKQGKPFKIISDIGSGIDYAKPGLKELLKLISTNQVDTIYVLYKDRLVRCGFELIEEFAKLHNTKIEVINQTEGKIDVEEFVDDIVNLISVFSYILSCQTNRKKIDINEKIIQRLSNLKEKQ